MKFWIFIITALCSVMTPIDLRASIIKKPPEKTSDLSYKDLVCTEEDQKAIYKIISTMAQKGKLGLLLQQSSLREMGASINHVHPLKFLATIFKDPYLKSCMPIIWNDYFKRHGFLDGLAPSLTREAEKGKLQKHLPDFAKDVGVDEKDLKSYVEVHDWSNLVLFLMQS